MVSEIQRDYKISKNTDSPKGLDDTIDQNLSKIQQILIKSIDQPELLFQKNQLLVREQVCCDIFIR